MNEDLTRKTEEWMQLSRKTPEEWKIADQFYYDNLMSLIEADYIARNKDKLYEKVKYLILSVGTSYEPIILNIKLFNPDKILFLYTNESEKTLEQIVNYTKLSPISYEKCKVSGTEPEDIYREIKHSFIKWGKPEKVYIDFTGGTKAMSVAAAMAGTLINVQLVYVGSNQYLKDFRKPKPGSETLFFITNPLAVFGDLEIEKALLLFQQYNYAAAKEKLNYLKENIPDAVMRQQLDFVYLLARSYEAWDSLDFCAAYNHMSQLNKKLYIDRINRDYILMDSREHLQKQEVILGYLKEFTRLMKNNNYKEVLENKNIMTALMFTLYQNACTREEQGKYDMSTLLLYRLLEMIEQSRLSHYNLYTSQMDYENMSICEEQMPEWASLSSQERIDLLQEKRSSIYYEIFGTEGDKNLMERVSLIDGYVILLAFQDPIVMEDDGKNCLKKMKDIVFLRNNSMFAHGFAPVTKSNLDKFKRFVKEKFSLYCNIEEIDFDTYLTDMKLVNPFMSKSKL